MSPIGVSSKLHSGAEVEDGPVGSTGVLVQTINHSTGKNTWKMMSPDYDYHQEVARASFADMLHDSERNKLYYAGLKAAIKKKRDAGEEVHVLDIGTGTGLLSMMAAREGADSVVACEEFRPMADTATKVIADNGLTDKIKLVRKRSTEMTVGPGGDMERRANILITEVFDTELIGEGAIGTYNHAAKHLLTEDRLVVPGVARIWAQLVTSSKCSDWSRPQPIPLGLDDHLIPPVQESSGNSSLALHDLQLSQLDVSHFTPLTPPLEVFRLDLSCVSGDIPLTDQSSVSITSLATGPCDAVFMWWDCWTDPDQTILLSCAPHWASHHPPSSLPWRDHWMQAIYYPTIKVDLKEGEDVTLVSCHDEYSLWFDVRKEKIDPNQKIAMPSPGSGLQMAMSRSRLGQTNNRDRNLKMAKVVKKLVENHSEATFLCLGEQSLLGLMVAKLGAKQVILCCENNRHMRDYITTCAAANNVSDRLTLLESEEILQSTDLSKVGVVISEPHYTVSVLPWHNLLFWYTLSNLKLPQEVTISPCRASLYLIPVHYTNLWKIRAPLGHVEGFSMSHFDEIMEKASKSCDQQVEPHPLWEYPSVALANPHKVVQFNLTEEAPGSQGTNFTGELTLDLHASQLNSINGVALWMEWSLDEETVLSGGPSRSVVVGKEITWDMDSKQGVHLLNIIPSSPPRKLNYSIDFLPTDGDFSFKFWVE